MTAHGGVITGPGCVTVLIGNMPAATLGDMHTCPMQTPAPTPIPHVGGPITGPGVVTVLIGGKPAVTVGDMAICVGPPDSILPPGCPTVLIGTGGGGGGGGGGAGMGSGSGQTATAAVGSSGDSEGEQGESEDEDHYLDVKVVDKGGFPIGGVMAHVTGPGGYDQHHPVMGGITIRGIESGSYDLEMKALYNARWSVEEAEIGQTVKLTADVSGIENGTPVEVKIYLRDINRPDDELVKLETEVSGEKAEVEWQFEVNQELLDRQTQREDQGGYSIPCYYFVVRADGCEARSGILRYKDYIELRLRDREGNPIGNRPYELILPSGEIRQGTLDGDGYAREEAIPPGRVRVRYNVRSDSSQSQ